LLAAYNRKDAQALGDLVTDDFVFISEGHQESGRQAWIKGWQQNLPLVNGLRITILDRVVSLDLALETQRFSQQVAPPGKPAFTDSGYALAASRRIANGQWQYYRLMLSRVPPTLPRSQ
jgi:ketosteroid isomerase-like protein